MNIRQAMYSAANQIEQRPKLFDFMNLHIPDNCGTPGCVLGWIGYYAGITGLSEIVVPKLLGFRGAWEQEVLVFYNRLDAFSEVWKYDASKCAKALRLYADKYHPADNVIPESVMAIFNKEVVYVDK